MGRRPEISVKNIGEINPLVKVGTATEFSSTYVCVSVSTRDVYKKTGRVYNIGLAWLLGITIVSILLSINKRQMNERSIGIISDTAP